MNLEVFLAVLVGLVLGTLIALIIDGYTMAQRVKSANTHRNQAQEDLQKTQADLHKTNSKLVAAQTESKSLTQELLNKKNELSDQTAVIEHQQKELEATATKINTLNDNLNRVNQHLDEIRQENQTLDTQLASAQQDNITLRDNFNRTDNELQAVQAEKQAVCERLTVNELELHHLKENMAQTRTLADRAGELATEKDALAWELRQSEQQVAELRAQVNSVLRQLTETQFLRRRLLETDQKLKTAESQLEDMQTKLKLLQSHMAYSGKNQLQIIKGIGPTYAKKLNEHGIYTLKELARTDPEKVREFINPKNWQRVEPEEWIDEARLLATHFEEE